MSSLKCRGFTMIELMFVVAIIGILAAIALPAYQDYISRARVAESMVVIAEAKVAVNNYYKYTGLMPVNNAEAGLAEPGLYRANHVSELTVDKGAIHVRFDKKAVGDYVLSFRPLSNEHDLSLDLVWTCQKDPEHEGLVIWGEAKTDIEKGFLPSNCRD